MKVVIMGQGYVGLPLAMAAARAGHQVVGYELDPIRLTQLRANTSYVEDVASATLHRYRALSLYTPTDDVRELKEFDVAIITVPTPLKDGKPDLTYVAMASHTLANHLTEGALIVLESTTYPGTTRDVIVPLLERTAYGMRAGLDFHVAFSPERIDPGNREWNFENTPKLVAGLTSRCLDLAQAFYSTVTDKVIEAESLEAAELAKCFENTYRQVNIALVNELGRMAHLVGVDVWHTLELCDSKPFGFTKFTPGPGVGGHCLPVDPMYLAHHMRNGFGEAFRLIELAQDVNDGQPAYVVRRLQDALNDRQGRALKHSRILALGAAYKADTADRRESPAVEVVNLLRAKGAKVDVVDPFFDRDNLGAEEWLNLTDLRLHEFHAVVILTAHTDIDLTRVVDEATYVLDTRGVIDTREHDHIERL